MSEKHYHEQFSSWSSLKEIILISVEPYRLVSHHNHGRAGLLYPQGGSMIEWGNCDLEDLASSAKLGC